MDDKKEFNDILIGGDDGRAGQSKKIILLIIGIVILVLAIAIIVMMMLGGNKKAEEDIVIKDTENIDQMLPAGITNQQPEDDFETIINEIKKQEEAGQAVESMPPRQVEKPEPPKATIPPKRVAQPAKPKPAPQPSARVVDRRNNGDIATRGHYLQVGAFSREPDSAWLARLDKYSYRTQEVMINSNVITRYLVGPYTSRAEAQQDFDSVSRSIATPVHLQVQ